MYETKNHTEFKCCFKLKNAINGIGYRRRSTKGIFQLGRRQENSQVAYIRINAFNNLKQIYEYRVSSITKIHQNFQSKGMLTLAFTNGSELSLTEVESAKLDLFVTLISYLKKQKTSRNILNQLPLLQPITPIAIPYIKQSDSTDLLVDRPQKSLINLNQFLVKLEILNCPNLINLPTNFIKLTSLHTLICSNTAIEDPPVTMPPNLRFLNLSRNCLTDSDFPAMANLCRLQSLDLSYNELTRIPQGLALLATNQRGMLKSLNLSNNQLNCLCFDLYLGYDPECCVDISSNSNLPIHEHIPQQSYIDVTMDLRSICVNAICLFLSHKHGPNIALSHLTRLLTKSAFLLNYVHRCLSVCMGCNFLCVPRAVRRQTYFASNLLVAPNFPDVTYSSDMIDMNVVCEFRFCSMKCLQKHHIQIR